MVMPHYSVWDDARDAFDAAQPGYQDAPDPAQRAIDALGDLLGIYDGYGEDDDA